MLRFLRLAALAIGIQILAWAIIGGLAAWFIPSFDRYLEGFVYVYYLAVALVASFGRSVGEANIIRPILIGVPLGIILYGIWLRSAFLRHQKNLMAVRS